VVGEIEDEFDQDLATAVIEDTEGWVVPGFLSLKRLEGLVGRAIEEPEDIESVGGLIADLEDGEVTPGTAVVWDHIELRVDQVEDGRASRVRVVRPPKRRR